MSILRLCILGVSALLASCAASLPPAEVTPDGLVRVPSRPEGGVYRKPNADFTRYKRLMIEPLTVEFRDGWRKQHPDVSDAEVRRIEAETAVNFLEEFTEVMVDEGPFTLTEVRDAEVLVVVPRMLDLKIPAPESEFDAGFRRYSPLSISLEITGELRDGMSGEVLLRVVMIEPEQFHKTVGRIPGPNRVANAHEIRFALEKWSRLVREAIDVAKATQPH
jgi:hypothetical protein